MSPWSMPWVLRSGAKITPKNDSVIFFDPEMRKPLIWQDSGLSNQ